MTPPERKNPWPKVKSNRSKSKVVTSDEAIQEYLKSVVLQKKDRHHIGEPVFVQPEWTMSCIGG